MCLSSFLQYQNMASEIDRVNRNRWKLWQLHRRSILTRTLIRSKSAVVKHEVICGNCGVLGGRSEIRKTSELKSRSESFCVTSRPSFIHLRHHPHDTCSDRRYGWLACNLIHHTPGCIQRTTFTFNIAWQTLKFSHPARKHLPLRVPPDGLLPAKALFHSISSRNRSNDLCSPCGCRKHVHTKSGRQSSFAPCCRHSQRLGSIPFQIQA